MKTVERTCRCGARLVYTDEDWRVDVAVEDFEDQHTRCRQPAPAAPTCEIAPIVNSAPAAR